MNKTLTFLHTSPAHIDTFTKLLAEIDPTIPVKHLVDESLLNDARAYGMTPELTQRITHTVQSAIADNAAVVVCTCSTIGGAAEKANASPAVDRTTGRTVMRVDRAMAEHAVTMGKHIIIAAALESTLAPTRQLILEAAEQLGEAVTISEILCADAWAYFERNDHTGYLAAIATSLQEAAPAGDVIVLAQASMAGAASLCTDLSIPILSSPRLGLEAALRTYRTQA